jgi:hypothetical protein
MKSSGTLLAFGLTLFLSIVAGPALHLQGMRAPASQTGEDCPCKVKVNCDVQTCTFPFDPATIPGLDKKGLADLAAAAVAHCKATLPCIEHFKEKWVADNVAVSFEEIKNKVKDADTFTTNVALKDVDVKCVDKREDGKGGTVTINLCAIALTVFPNGGGQLLKDHEAGHVAIQKHYFCERMAPHLEKKITDVVCAKKYKDEKDLKHEATKLTLDFAKEFQEKVGKLSGYQDTFNTNTDDGRKGVQADEVKKITDAIDAKFRAAFP